MFRGNSPENEGKYQRYGSQSYHEGHLNSKVIFLWKFINICLSQQIYTLHKIIIPVKTRQF